MPNLDYGYTIRIASEGVLNPPSAVTRQQWQRQQYGSTSWADITTGSTYTVQNADRNCKIRLSEEHASGQAIYSNELQVTNDAPSGGWEFKGSMGGGMATSLAYQNDTQAMVVAFRDGRGYKITSDFGNSWQQYSHSIDVPIACFIESDGETVMLAGYGGHELMWTKRNSHTVVTGFPRNTYLYGCGRTPSGGHIATDINGDVWLSRRGISTSSWTKDSNSAKWTANGQSKTIGTQPQISGANPIGAARRGYWVYVAVDVGEVVGNFHSLPFQGSGNDYVHDVAFNPDTRTIVAGGSRAHVWRNGVKKPISTSIIPGNCDITGVARIGSKFYITGAYTGKLYLASSTDDGNNWVAESLPAGLNQTGWTSAKMVGGNQYGTGAGVWTFNQSSSPYATSYCIFRA